MSSDSDNDKVSRDNLGFYDKIITETKTTNRPVLIFPQATRTPVDEKIPFKKGVAKIYEKLNFQCIPVALNSGNVWPKSGRKISNKTITISIMPRISNNFDKEMFLKILEDKIYSELDLIN